MHADEPTPSDNTLEADNTSKADSSAQAGEGTAGDETSSQTGRRRGGRRAASRPAGPPAAVFSAAEGSEAAPTTEIVVPSAAVAAVFQAPEPEAVQPRRRRAPSTAKANDGEQPESAPDDSTGLATGETVEGAKPKKKSAKKKTKKSPAESTGDDKAGTENTADISSQEAQSVATDHSEASVEGDSDADAGTGGANRRRRRRGGRGRGRKSESQQQENDDTQPDVGGTDGSSEAEAESSEEPAEGEENNGDGGSGNSRRRRRRRRRGGGGDDGGGASDSAGSDEVTAVKGSTRLEAKRQRRREGRANRGMRAPILTEAEFLARREAVDRAMVMRQHHGVTQIAVLEDDVLVEHYVSSSDSSSMIGNVYVGRVQNVLPSMEAAFVDIGRGRNAVLYAGEVNWDAAGLEGQPKRIELALKAGDEVMVQVTKDPIGHKGARLTSQISLPGRFLVYVPQGGMTGISRKLPDRERGRLKRILKTVVPEDAGVIVRTAAEGASEEQLRQDVERLAAEWQAIESKAGSVSAPSVLRSEPDLAIKVVRDIFNEDFGSLTISGNALFDEVSTYVSAVAPDLVERTRKWVDNDDVFTTRRIDEQLAKALDRKVWLPSGGSLVIDRTEAMTVIDVNTGKFVGKGGNLEETVTRNNLEAAEEIVRQLRLRDIGGIIVVDFIDMVLESNRELVLRRLVECLSRDRTKHQVAEVTSLGLVQMTRKRIGQGLLETFSTPCETCNGRGVKVQSEPLAAHSSGGATRVRRQRITGPIPGAPIATPTAGEASDSAADAPDAADAPEATADASEVTDASEAARDKAVGADNDAEAEGAAEASDSASAPPTVESRNEGGSEVAEGVDKPDDAPIHTQGETPDLVGGGLSAADSQTR